MSTKKTPKEPREKVVARNIGSIGQNSQGFVFEHGSVGAVAFGPGAKATNHGNVSTTITPNRVETLLTTQGNQIKVKGPIETLKVDQDGVWVNGVKMDDAQKKPAVIFQIVIQGNVNGPINVKGDLVVEGNVTGPVNTTGDITCMDIKAEEVQCQDLHCRDIHGAVHTENATVSQNVMESLYGNGDVKVVGDVHGNLHGQDVEVGGDVAGSVKGECDILVKGSVEGGVYAEGDVALENVTGDVTCHGDLEAQNVTGNVVCHGDMNTHVHKNG